jgi:hypothetical protein
LPKSTGESRQNTGRVDTSPAERTVGQTNQQYTFVEYQPRSVEATDQPEHKIGCSRVEDLANRLGNCSVARNDQSEMIDGTKNHQQHLADAGTEDMTMASGSLSTASNDHPTHSQRDLDTRSAERIRALHFCSARARSQVSKGRE